VSQGKQRWPEKRYDRGVEWEGGVLPKRSELLSLTSTLSPLMCAMLLPGHTTLACATLQESFVSPRRGGREARGRRHAASPRAKPNNTLHTAV
jgi:hypothetical protein